MSAYKDGDIGITPPEGAWARLGLSLSGKPLTGIALVTACEDWVYIGRKECPWNPSAGIGEVFRFGNGERFHFIPDGYPAPNDGYTPEMEAIHESRVRRGVYIR